MSDEWEVTEERMAIAEIAAKTEPELLAAIDYQDHAARIVYADWLEEHDDAERAEFVRLQDALVGAEDETRAAIERRCQAIAMRTDIAWRCLVARSPIRGCSEPACPGEWGSLAPSDRTDVRICMTCNDRVFYCAHTVDASKRLRFVLDATNRT